MGLTIVVGGQYGGEGKGLITAFLAQKAEMLIKIGGPNSAHSFGIDQQMFRVRMIPSGANLGAKALIFPAGCLIHIDTLFEEIETLNYTGDIIIDPNAGIINSETVISQRQDSHYENIGSTLTGSGHASSLRALRRLTLAKSIPRLREYLADTTLLLSKAIIDGCQIIAEGAQAYGLSNYHGDYPYVSSRDTTVGSVISQMGLGPNFIKNIILVVKCFPTRNSGGIGFMANELSGEYVEKNGEFLLETGGSTYGAIGAKRRVALFDFDLVDKACIANTPTMIAVTGIDRLSGMMRDEIIVNHYGSIEKFLQKLESRYKVPIGLISKGPYISDVIDLRNAI